MICEECGTEINENETVCSNCGEKVKDADNTSTPSGELVTIKLKKVGMTVTSQRVTIRNEYGEELWVGHSGETAEIYFKERTPILIEYDTGLEAWGGICQGVIDPSECKKYTTKTKRSLLKIKIILEKA